MEASEWTYAGEGGKHALFAYSNTAALSPSSCSSQATIKKWQGRLLRIDKKFLRMAAARASSATTSTMQSSACASKQEDAAAVVVDENDDDDTLQFLRDVMHPHFVPYLDLPQRVLLSWRFLHNLRNSTMQLQPCPIPPSRRTSWQVTNPESNKPQEGSGKMAEQSPVGYLLWDYRHIIGLSAATMNPPPARSGCLSVEVKPKAGYLPSSPLIEPKHRAKFLQSRFVLLQELDRLGHGYEIPRGWRKDETRTNDTSGTTSSHQQHDIISRYDPLDLFSLDETRIQRALEALWECPQNNFKLWCTPVGGDGVSNNVPVLIFADNHYFQTASAASFSPHLACKQPLATSSHIIRDFLGNAISSFEDKDDSNGQPLHTTFIHHLLGCILQAEGVFLNDKLRQWQQRLDILDADGAILVYQKLVELCQGSHRQAQQLLDTYSAASKQLQSPQEQRGTSTTTTQSNDSFVAIDFFSWSPLEPPQDCFSCPAFVALMEEIHRFSNVIHTIRHSETTALECRQGNHATTEIKAFLDQEHERSRRFCLQQIALIQSIPVCCYLLQNWLLSLAVCDVSFFVTLQPIQIPVESLKSKNVLFTSEARYHHLEESRGMNIATRVILHQSEQEPGVVQVGFQKEDEDKTAATFMCSGTNNQSTTAAPPFVKSTNDTAAAIFQYQIKMIDCDKKPSKKLESRHEKEHVFQFWHAHNSGVP